MGRIMNITSMSCSALFTMLFAVSVCEASSDMLKSPPLPAINNRCLVLTIPQGWRIVRQDDASRWQTASFNFDVARSHKKTVGIEILNYDKVRAQIHSDLVGKPFRTSAGYRGVIHQLSFAPGQTDWYFALPDRATGYVLIVRLVGLSGTSKVQRMFASQIFKPIRFVRPATFTYQKSVVASPQRPG